MGYEEKELKPYKEPAKDLLDSKRLGKSVTSVYHIHTVCNGFSLLSSSPKFETNMENGIAVWVSSSETWQS